MAITPPRAARAHAVQPQEVRARGRELLARLFALVVGLGHRLVRASRGSVNRDRLVQEAGVQCQVPYLVDPNTETEMFESADIVAYLDREYAR